MGFIASLNSSSFSYLGLPIFRKLAYSRDWVPLLDKFKAKIQAWGFSWLNLGGKSVLIKSVLCSLPIFQFSIILAPSGILKKMEAFIHKFFWKGGNHNDRKIPLVSWEKIFKPQSEGGLNFKDISLQNIPMGAKIFWRIIGLHPGCSTLWDISQWEGRIWLRWRLPPVPPDLSQARDLLITLLNGMAPLRVGNKDARGWGAAPGLYTVAQGYKSLHDHPYVPPNPIVWNEIWNCKSMPKIDSFC
eukprot:PITA_08467